MIELQNSTESGLLVKNTNKGEGEGGTGTQIFIEQSAQTEIVRNVDKVTKLK